MYELERWMELATVVARMLKWPAMALFYFLLIKTLGLFGWLLLGTIMGFTVLAFAGDKAREAKGADDFFGGRLFFRYGAEIERIYVPIAASPEGDRQADQLSTTLRLDLGARARAHLPAASADVTETLPILDQGTQRTKEFLRLLARTPGGCQVAHFVHFAPFGSAIAAHLASFARGRYTDWDVFKFVFSSPFSIWLWGVPWLLNRNSLISMVSHFTDSAFDALDVQTVYTTTRQLLLAETECLLKEAGLLSEAVSQIINHFTTQQINVNKSSRVTFGAVTNAASSPLSRVA